MNLSVVECMSHVVLLQLTQELGSVTYTCLFKSVRLPQSYWFTPSELWHLVVVTLSEKLLSKQKKGFGSVWCHKYLSNILINIPHLGPTLTSFMTILYDVFSHDLPFIACFLSGTQGEQQRCGWMNIKTFTMLPSPLQETSLMESRCDNVWPTDDGIIKGANELLFYVIFGLALQYIRPKETP